MDGGNASSQGHPNGAGRTDRFKLLEAENIAKNGEKSRKQLTEPTPHTPAHHINPILLRTSHPPHIPFRPNRTPFLIPLTSCSSLRSRSRQVVCVRYTNLGRTARGSKNNTKHQKTHPNSHHPNTARSRADSLSFIVRMCMLSTVVWFRIINSVCDRPKTVVNSANTAALFGCNDT